MTPARAVGLFLVAASACGLYVGVTTEGGGRAVTLMLVLVAGVAGGVTLFESRRATAPVQDPRPRPGRHRR
jgi:hypothetical protein